MADSSKFAGISDRIKAGFHREMHRNMRADIATYIVTPILFVAVVAVLAVLLLAWAQAVPILTQVSNSLGLQPTGTSGTGIAGLNQTTYLQVGNQLYNFDVYIAFIFYFLLIATCLSTLFLNPNPISWYVCILFSPFVYWIGSYVSNWAYKIFTMPIFATVTPFMGNVIFIMAQLQDITIIFFFMYIVCMAVRIYFYNPATPQQRQTADMSEMLLEGGKRRGMF